MCNSSFILQQCHIESFSWSKSSLKDTLGCIQDRISSIPSTSVPYSVLAPPVPRELRIATLTYIVPVMVPPALVSLQPELGPVILTPFLADIGPVTPVPSSSSVSFTPDEAIKLGAVQPPVGVDLVDSKRPLSFFHTLSLARSAAAALLFTVVFRIQRQISLSHTWSKPRKIIDVFPCHPFRDRGNIA